MTASQMKRIRRKIDQAATLMCEAHDLAVAGHADYGLREITARGADDMGSALRQLGMWDDRMRANAEAIARDLMPVTPAVDNPDGSRTPAMNAAGQYVASPSQEEN
jgi:hypothetical protein